MSSLGGRRSNIVSPYLSTVNKIVYLELDAERFCISTIHRYANINCFLKECSSVVCHPDETGIVTNLFKHADSKPHRILEIENIHLSNGYTRNFKCDYLYRGKQKTVLGSELLKGHKSRIFNGVQSDLKLFNVAYTYTENAVFIEIKAKFDEDTILSAPATSCRYILCLLIPLMNYIPKNRRLDCLFSEYNRQITLDYLINEKPSTGEIKTHTFCLTII